MPNTHKRKLISVAPDIHAALLKKKNRGESLTGLLLRTVLKEEAPR